MTSSLPIIAVPTTYAGSEATNVWGPDGGIKKDHWSGRIRPAGNNHL